MAPRTEKPQITNTLALRTGPISFLFLLPFFLSQFFVMIPLPDPSFNLFTFPPLFQLQPSPTTCIFFLDTPPSFPFSPAATLHPPQLVRHLFLALCCFVAGSLLGNPIRSMERKKQGFTKSQVDHHPLYPLQTACSYISTLPPPHSLALTDTQTCRHFPKLASSTLTPQEP